MFTASPAPYCKRQWSPSAAAWRSSGTSVNFLKVAAAIELVFTLGESVFNPAWLPLGGSSAAQIGICLGLGLAIHELHDALK